MTGKLYSAPEVADLLGLKLDTIYRYARAGALRGLKIGKLWRFDAKDVDDFVNSRRHEAIEDVQRVEFLSTMLSVSAQRSNADSGIICGDRLTTYAELDRRSSLLALALINKGLQPGDRVFVVLPNSSEFVIACFAVWKAGGVLIPEDNATHLKTIRHIVDETQPFALLVDRNAATRLEEIQDALGSVKAAWIKDAAFALHGLSGVEVQSLDAVWDDSSGDSERLHLTEDPEEVVSINYTSGSTGIPKGVMHTHASWLAASVFTREFTELSSRDKMVILLPLHHAYTFRQILACVSAGTSIIIADDIYQALKSLREHRPTSLLLVPAAANIMLDHYLPILESARTFLRYVEVGSAAMGPERLDQLRRALPTTKILAAYGLTEARVAYLEQGPDGLINRMSPLAPGLDLQITNRFGRPVASVGESGEIWLRGKGLMKGYWNAQSGKVNGLDQDGWFHTGDLGRFEENKRVALLGRDDEFLKIGGRKVNPIEVETTLNLHPAIVESAVVGKPDPKGILERELHAFVVVNREVSLDDSDLRSHCMQYLEHHKVPAKFHHRTSLPKSPIGKIQRHTLTHS